MSIFSNFSKQSAQRRLDDLTERLEKLEREMRALQLEWENTYDKVRQMMGRIAKRAELLHEDAEKDGRLYPSDSPDAPPSTLPVLTPRQRLIQSQIAKRRQGVQ